MKSSQEEIFMPPKEVLLIFLVKNALLFITSSIVCQHFQSTEIK